MRDSTGEVIFAFIYMAGVAFTNMRGHIVGIILEFFACDRGLEV